MNTVLLSWDDATKLLEWALENKSLVHQFPEPLKNVCITIEKWEAKIERYGNKVKIHHRMDGIKKGDQEFKLGKPVRWTSDKTELMGPDRQTMIATYAAVMAYMVYAPKKVVKKPHKTVENTPETSRKATKGYTYILHSIGNPTPQGSHHKSPQGIFTVRGHYRHYKNGKVLWIAEYKKGTGKELGRTYKL